MRYRKKPIIIEATQWYENGDHPLDRVGEKDIDPLTGKSYKILEGRVVRYFRHPDVQGHIPCQYCGVQMHNHGWIDTLEGGHIVCPGDWIITGVNGEKYPCKPDIFEKTYDTAEEQENKNG